MRRYCSREIEHSSEKITLSKVSPLSSTRWTYSSRFTLFGSRMSWQYAVRCNVQPSFLRIFLTVAEHTEIPNFTSFFWIWPLVISSFFRICWFMKACASLLDSFAGLPERGRFATEPVILSFLMIHVTLERLTAKPSLFRDLNIPTGGRPC